MISADQVRGAVRPLRFIFWGGLLCIFDITFASTTTVGDSTTGLKFDLLDDTLGAILITLGIARLGAVAGVQDPRYATLMRWIRWVSYAAIVATIDGHFIYARPAPLSFLLEAFGLVRLVAAVAFCVSMKWFCESARGLERATRSWGTTTVLLVALYALPLAFLYCASLAAIAGHSAFHMDLGPAGLLLLVVLVVPLVHMFVSTSRMAREADNVLDDPYDAPAPGSWAESAPASPFPKRGVLVGCPLLLGLAALAFLLTHLDARVFTGDFCEFKIESAEIGPAPDYYVSLSYREHSSSGTEVTKWSLRDGEPWQCGMSAHGFGGPFDGPGGGSGSLGFSLNPEGDPMNASEARRRLLVRTGQTVNLKPGERITLYKFRDSQGDHEQWFEVRHPH